MPPALSTSPSFGERYRVERELGRGGMATVYLCTDTKFDRSVAIKLLHHDLAAALGAERFHREIKIATGLTHPNILPAYDSGEAEGSLYYVMPFVEGESLRARMDRERQLPVQDAIRITCEIAGALQYAHTHGIVHRDIKPENILLEADHAVLADFGIARAITSAGDVEALTRTGMSLGTPGYMSPEQALGEKNIDGRSDQYSLACVTYEMLTGQPPFVAPTMQALVAKHLSEAAPLITTVRPSVPDEIEDVILRALEKVPADRFSSCGEFSEALSSVVATTGTWARRTGSMTPVRASRRTNAIPAPVRASPWRRAAIAAGIVVALIGGAAATWRWSDARTNGVLQMGDQTDGLDTRGVAILYFEDQSGDSSLRHAADGLTEGLIQELGQVRALRIVSARGVAPFRGSDVRRDSIARALGVRNLIEGTIEPVGSRVRVTTRLVDGLSGADVPRARATFELPAGQIVGALDSLAGNLATFLRERLGTTVVIESRRASTASSEAWDLAQRAERVRKDADASVARDPAGARRLLEEADSLLALAEAADPRWVDPILARGWLALRRSQLERGLAGAPFVDAGLAHAERAVDRSPRPPRGLELRGTLRYRKYQLKMDPRPAALAALLVEAREDLETAVTADASLTRANLTLSQLYYLVDDVPGALIRARQAYEADAYLEQADGILLRLFWGSLDLEQFREAQRWCDEGYRRFPSDHRFMQCQLWLLATPAVAPNAQRAAALLAGVDSAAPANQRAFIAAQSRIIYAGALARADQRDSARAVLRTARQQITSEIDPHGDLLSQEAYARTLTGEPDAAIDLLKRYAAANPDHPFAERAGTVWWWRDLRVHPRWREVSQR